MKPVPTSREHDHHFVNEVLPWYFNGTLDAASMSLVREHTATCAECRLAMEREARLAGAIRELPIVDRVPQPSLTKVMARIDAHEARWSWLSRLLNDGSGPRAHRALALTAGFQAVAIVLLAIVLTTLGTRPAAEYRTLSNESAERHEGPLLRVVFDGQLTAEALRELIEQVDGSIARGPDETGLFTVNCPRAPGRPRRLPTGCGLSPVSVLQKWS